MPNSIETNAVKILSTLATQEPDEMGIITYTGSQIRELTELNPAEINDAVTILEESGYVELQHYIGTAPFVFGEVTLTSRGKYEYERMQHEEHPSRRDAAEIYRPPTPVGSPFGFSDVDWESVTEIKSRHNQLNVVFGFQFSSSHYDAEHLKNNVKRMFEEAVESYNNLQGVRPVELSFQPLAAGYGEHLFNEIARDIISADIAVFDTSDLNPNVMLEMGVALTWGVRVLPIKKQDCPKPPSDISGQTWADYASASNGSEFVDSDHQNKLLRMVERAARKKGSRA